MKQSDIVKYCDLMEEVKRRVAVIDAFISGSTHAVYAPTTSESICLQLRKILELIAMASLVANKYEFSKVYTEFAKYWNAQLLLRDLERISPDFYPKPIIEHPSRQPNIKSEWQDRTLDFLDKASFVRVYKKCGAIMHAGNPHGSRVDYGYYQKSISRWRTKVVNLLNSHHIRMAGDPNIYLIHMKEDRDDKVHYYVFEPAAHSR